MKNVCDGFISRLSTAEERINQLEPGQKKKKERKKKEKLSQMELQIRQRITTIATKTTLTEHRAAHRTQTISEGL